jgi:hypothetical protein
MLSTGASRNWYVASASCRLGEIRDIENDDLGHINIEIECRWSRENLGHISVPRATRNRVDNLRVHGDRLTAIDGNGHGSRRGGNGDWRR